MTFDEKTERVRLWLDRPVVLIGLMGAGKSKLGRKLAPALGIPLVDTDTVIESQTQKTITEFFDQCGEAAFRDVEAKVVSDALSGDQAVIATGGGAVMRDETSARIFAEAISIWVRADLATMLERTAKNNDRPLLNAGDPEKTLKDLIVKRYPTYEKADIVVDSTNLSSFKMLEQAIDQLHDILERRHAA